MAAERVSGHCALLYHPNNGISLRESFRFQTTPTGFGLGQICQAFSPVAAKHRIIHCLLARSLLRSFPPPTSFFLSLSFGGMKPLTDRWADGDRQCSPRRKLIGRDWKRDSVGLNSPDMMGKSMRASSAFAYRERSATNALSAGSH